MRRRDANSARTAWLVVAGLVVFMLVLAGCGSSSDSTSGGSDNELQKLGKGEGELNLISWAGYVEDEWTKPFEQESGCKVNDKVAGTSDEMVDLMKTGQYDGVSASGNATARLVAANEVDPVNVGLVPNYKTIFSDLKDQPYNTFDGVHYGIPHGRGANLLMWNSDDVKPAPTSWDVMFDPKMAAQVQGQDQRRTTTRCYDRRRSGLPEIPPAGPGNRKPLRAQRRAVRTRRSTCSRNSSPTSANTGRTRRSRSRPSPAATSRSAPPGSTSTSRCWKKMCRSLPAPPARASCPRRARPVGRTPG